MIEDDAFRDLALDGDPPPPLLHADRDGHVVYVRSLAKAAAPGPAAQRGRGTRPGGGAAAADAAGRGHARAGHLPEATVELVTAPGWARHLRRTRKPAARAARLAAGGRAVRARDRRCAPARRHARMGAARAGRGRRGARRAGGAAQACSCSRGGTSPGPVSRPVPADHLRGRAAGAPRRGRATAGSGERGRDEPDELLRAGQGGARGSRLGDGARLLRAAR